MHDEREMYEDLRPVIEGRTVKIADKGVKGLESRTDKIDERYVRSRKAPLLYGILTRADVVELERRKQKWKRRRN